MALGIVKPIDREIEEGVPPAAGTQDPSGVGAQLRLVRLERGLTAEQVGAALFIKPRYIEALERGDASGIPGTAYAVGYVRSYAAFLGFDGDEAARRFKAELNYVPAKPLVFPAPKREASFPTGRILAMSLIFAVLIYGGYYYVSRSGKVTEANLVPPVPPELVAAASKAGEAPAAPAPESSAAGAAVPDAAVPDAAETAAVPPAAPAPSGAPSATLPIPDPGLVPPPLTANAAPSAAQGAPPAAPGGGRVVLRATADAWVQVRGPGNEQIFTKVLRAGEIYAVPPRNDATLITGNAGALEIVVDGKSSGPLGTVGSVRRNISLDPDKLLADMAHPPT